MKTAITPTSDLVESSDPSLLDLLNRSGPLGVGEMASAMGVTSTAVRQRLIRLMGQGLVGREATREGRGRPSHRYSLTSKGRREAGNNFADLSIALWTEIRAIKQPEIRAGLIQRIASHLRAMYEPQVRGKNTAEKMQSLVAMLAQRGVTFEARQDAGQLPVLKALACPYPELAEQDRSICSLEKILFSELLGAPMKLSECRLDGGSCCRFETS